MRPHLARPLICFTVKGGLIDREQRSNYAEYTLIIRLAMKDNTINIVRVSLNQPLSESGDFNQSQSNNKSHYLRSHNPLD